MTTASELFYNRRSRIGRTDHDLDLDSSPSARSFLPNSRNFHHRRALDTGESLRPPPHVGHACSRRVSFSLEEDTDRVVSSIRRNTNTTGRTNRPSMSGTDRLPGTVLLARARLLERLRGVSLSGNRRSSRGASGISRRQAAGIVGDEGSVNISSDREGNKKKPPGLSRESINSLSMEIFEIGKKEVKGGEVCGICLESFKEGEKLIRLGCGHRFHCSCLDPWVQTCGDCPYCREKILALYGK